MAGFTAYVWPIEHAVQALSRLVNADVFKRLFDAVPDNPDRQLAMAGAIIVKVHRPGQGAKGDSKSGHGQVKGRLDHQNPGAADALGIGAVRPAARSPA
jgi:hypothetical protein